MELLTEINKGKSMRRHSISGVIDLHETNVSIVEITKGYVSRPHLK
jgi:hypothetical protein